MDSYNERDATVNEHTGLNSAEKQFYRPQSFCSRLRLQMKSGRRRPNSLGYRIVKPRSRPYPSLLFEPSNRVDNTKYTWYNFVLLFLYFEFSQFSNLNYLLLCVSQFFPALKVGGLTRLPGVLHHAAGDNSGAAVFGGGGAALPHQEAGQREQQ